MLCLQTIKVWDPRNPQPLVKSVPLPGRVFAISSAGDRLVVAMSGRLVHIYDVRKWVTLRICRGGWLWMVVPTSNLGWSYMFCFPAEAS